MPALMLARRFAFTGFLLLLFMGLLISGLAVSQLREMALQEAQARARLVAEEMAGQIQLAVDVGIPLDRLVGVEDLFAQRMQSFQGILRAALLDTRGRVLHERRLSQADAMAPVVLPISQAGEPVAWLELHWRQPVISALMLPWGLPLAALVALTAGLAGEALRYALTGLVLRRERLVHASCQRIAAGDLATRPPRLGRRDFDNRLPWLTEQLRHVSEQHVRVERLAQSLRQTEPDAGKRHQLDQVLARAIDHDHFGGRPQAVAEIPASAQAALQRWRGVLLGLLAWTPMAAFAGYHPALVGTGALALLALLLVIAHRSHWWRSRASAWYGALLGGLVFGPALSLLGQMAWAPQHFHALGSPGYAAMAVLSMAALLLPWFGTPDREPLPCRMPHAA